MSVPGSIRPRGCQPSARAVVPHGGGRPGNRRPKFRGIAPEFQNRNPNVKRFRSVLFPDEKRTAEFGQVRLRRFRIPRHPFDLETSLEVRAIDGGGQHPRKDCKTLALRIGVDQEGAFVRNEGKRRKRCRRLPGGETHARGKCQARQVDANGFVRPPGLFGRKDEGRALSAPDAREFRRHPNAFDARTRAPDRAAAFCVPVVAPERATGFFVGKKRYGEGREGARRGVCFGGEHRARSARARLGSRYASSVLRRFRTRPRFRNTERALEGIGLVLSGLSSLNAVNKGKRARGSERENKSGIKCRTPCVRTSFYVGTVCESGKFRHGSSGEAAARTISGRAGMQTRKPANGRMTECPRAAVSLRIAVRGTAPSANLYALVPSSTAGPRAALAIMRSLRSPREGEEPQPARSSSRPRLPRQTRRPHPHCGRAPQ